MAAGSLLLFVLSILRLWQAIVSVERIGTMHGLWPVQPCLQAGSRPALLRLKALSIRHSHSIGLLGVGWARGKPVEAVVARVPHQWHRPAAAGPPLSVVLCAHAVLVAGTRILPVGWW